MFEKIWDKIGYIIMAGLLVGQFLIKNQYAIGQSIFIFVDVLVVFRDFILKRPKSDKIKNGVMAISAVSALIINL